MTTRDHERVRELTAAYVLGALDPGDRSELEVHLGGCDLCRQDVVDFAPLPALLGRVDASELEGHRSSGGDVDAVVAGARGQVAALERSRRRWRGVAAATAVAAVAVGAVLVVPDGEPVRRPEGVVLVVATASAETTAHVVATQRAWGTYVHVSAEALPARDAYEVWAVDTDGTWEPVGSWAPTPDGRAELGCSTALSLAEIDRVVVTSADRADELLVAAAPLG